MSVIPSGFGRARPSSGPTPRQRVKARLRAREVVLGINPDFPSAALAEHCARLGAELIFIDCEHGGPDMETVCDMVRAAHAEGAAAVVRPFTKDAGHLRRYMDAGLDGLIVPDLETVAELRAIAALLEAAAPPDAANFLVIGLIESDVGSRHLDDLLATGLLDAVLVGSGDLAVSIGVPRREDHPRVRALTFDIVRRAKAAGVSAGAPLNRYGLEPTVAAGGNLVMFFVKDLVRDRLVAECADLQRSLAGKDI